MATTKVLKRANPLTIRDKLLVGYQGWYTCKGDGEPIGLGHHEWLNWLSSPLREGGHPLIDFWPDLSEYNASELFPVPELKYRTGEQVYLFSSRKSETVQRHFNWMARHGVDGVFLRRCIAGVDGGPRDGLARLRDEVCVRVRHAAEKEGRVFAIMYDVSGVSADKIHRLIEQDWSNLVRMGHILDSPAYLKEKGKFVVGLSGIGFSNCDHTPDLLVSIVASLRQSTPGSAFIFAGTPAHWRTCSGDSDINPDWTNTWLREVDAISPWTVGQFKDLDDVDQWEQDMVIPDIDCIKNWNNAVEMNQRPGGKVIYVPVVFPGRSAFNASEGRSELNDIKRNGGKFLWKQIANMKKRGVNSIYGATWDNYTDGTAFLPAISKKRLLPDFLNFPSIAPDEDGYDLPPDWYMRICGFAGEALRSERLVHETFPVKELQDYWATRPKYEVLSTNVSSPAAGSAPSSSAPSATTSGGPAGQSEGSSRNEGANVNHAEWIIQEGQEQEAPPPYSLEGDGAPAPTTHSAHQGQIQEARPLPSPPVAAQFPEPQQALHAQAIPITSAAGTIPPQLPVGSASHSSSSSEDSQPGPSAPGQAVAQLNPGSFNSNPIVRPGTSDSVSRPHDASVSRPSGSHSLPPMGSLPISSSPPPLPSRPQQYQPSVPVSQTQSPMFSPPLKMSKPSEHWLQAQWPPQEWKIRPTSQPTHVRPSLHASSYPQPHKPGYVNLQGTESGRISTGSASIPSPQTTLTSSPYKVSQQPDQSATDPGQNNSAYQSNQPSSHSGVAQPHDPQAFPKPLLPTYPPQPHSAPSLPTHGGKLFPQPATNPQSQPLPQYSPSPDTPLPNPGKVRPPYPTAGGPPVQFPAAQHPMAQYPAAQYSPAQYSPAQYPPAQYPPAQYPQPQYPPSNATVHGQNTTFGGPVPGSGNPPIQGLGVPPPQHIYGSGQYPPHPGPVYVPPVAPASSSPLNPVGFALGAVDRIAGEDRRRQLERLAASGSKFLNKFK